MWTRGEQRGEQEVFILRCVSLVAKENVQMKKFQLTSVVTEARI